MRMQRTLLGLVFGLAAAGAVQAQATGTLRWRAGASPLGLQAPADASAPCGSVAFPCDAGTGTLRLYTSTTAPRSVSLQVGYKQQDAGTLGVAPAQGPSFSVIGKAGIAPDLGIYGRLGTTTRASLAGAPGSEGGITYGIGLSWDFSRRGSALLGWDSYDFRTLGGEARDVRATSLGLQWRY